ncbi:MAG: hypothetical protein COT81_05245 [Candidatus Buchananbacteria bacterium CG10_big_fil_rev_8_21_14_0_10_42_9]|uniref:L-asparaginase N-terminal domain-containing protein n=1 Tax=Candidatus Buchananbacteria bacterium CG10_big_fil_rev_8_21_14_0_10_42_9 TaxID=1974526 RepID=A0A2H0W004_9BACT|nr:MAG: hypothetical protein COT81_05245 [Candidatus Buchananbacteria bacterium CG10_big_fil_rev_8_21_14_0_10_42_9]
MLDKKIAILYCGSNTSINAGQFNALVKKTPELNIMADVDPIFVWSKPILDITAADWQVLASKIYSIRDNYDGFVVIHSSLGAINTATAVSFFIENLKQPILFTGSIGVSQAEIKSHWENIKTYWQNIKANLINAVQSAKINLPEVALLYSNQIVRANLTELLAGASAYPLYTADSGVLAKIDFSIRLTKNVLSKPAGKTKLVDTFNTNIEIINLETAVDYSSIITPLKNRDGLFIKTKNFYSVPKALENIIVEFGKTKPVAIHTDDNLEKDVPNSIVLKNMTEPAALIKFMWLLGQTKKINKAMMEKNYRGEIIR